MGRDMLAHVLKGHEAVKKCMFISFFNSFKHNSFFNHFTQSNAGMTLVRRGGGYREGNSICRLRI